MRRRFPRIFSGRDYRIEDFEVEGYAPHDAIRAEVAV